MKEKMKNKINKNETKKKSVQVSNKKGSITLFVLFSGLFFIMFLSTVLMYGAIKRQTEEEATKQAQELYGKQDEEEVYQQYFAEGAIPIYTKEQLAKIGSDEYVVVNEMGGLRYKFTTDGYYILMGDIELGGSPENRNWVPIGSQGKPFTGTLEGNGYVLYNLYNQNIGENYQGLFGYTQGATIQNITIESGQIQGKQYCAGLIGQGENTTIENIINKAQVQVTEGMSGGVIGWTNGEVIGCENYGKITSSGYTNDVKDTFIGGVAGYVDKGAQITKCINNADITAQYSCIGGVIGYSEGKIKEAVNNGAITVTGQNINKDATMGGVVGYIKQNEIEDCTNTGKVEAIAANGAGGIIGYLVEGKAYHCKNSGSVILQNGRHIGGIVGGSGTVDGQISKGKNAVIGCNNSGKVECLLGEMNTAPGTNIGLFAQAGGIIGNGFGIQIEDCTNQAEVYGNGLYVGGIVGNQDAGDIINCNNQGSVQAYAKNKNNDTAVGGIVGQMGSNSEKKETIKIEGCYNLGNIYGEGNLVGGIAGINDCNVLLCYNKGNVSGNQNRAVGGICGQIINDYTEEIHKIEKCYNLGEISGSCYIGGITGINVKANITQCYNLGNITATGKDEYSQSVVGGIAGSNHGDILSYCYNRGNVIGSYNLVAGITSYIENTTVSNCYSTTPNLSTPIVTAVISGSVNNCYYLGTVTSGQQRTESDMKTTTFRDLLGGTSIWKLDTENKNNGFIIFNWQ